MLEVLKGPAAWLESRINAPRHLAAALAASEARYRHLVENAPDIIYRTDANGNFTFVNPIAEAILGQSQAELLGHNYLELIDPADRDALRRRYGLQWAKRTPTTYAEFRVCTSSRQRIWIGQNVQLLIENGAPVGFQAVARDITDRKQAEEALAQVRRQNESILNSAAEGIVGVDREGCLVMANRSAAQLTGYSLSDMLGKPVHTLLHHAHDAGVPASECRMARALSAGSELRQQSDVFWRRDGSTFPSEYAIMPICDDEQPTGAVLSFHDISERAAIERMKSQIISILSHELRTPLAGVRGSLGLVASGLVPSDAQKQRMIQLAVENTDRLIRLANEIIDVQSLTTGDLRLVREDVQLEEIVAKSSASLRSELDATHIRIVQNVETGCVFADSERIVQVLTSLLENAIKFSPPESEVEVVARLRGHDAVFSVRDWGRGIPEHQLATLFTPMEQLDASDTRQQGGLGLGLAIARQIIELHGGQIGVESTLGTGSTFWFTLPASGCQD